MDYRDRACAGRRTHRRHSAELGENLSRERQLTDSAGAITDRYTYDVFGATRSSAGTTANDFRFTGQQDDFGANRGLYYLRARSYDPSLGRFLQRDPLPLANRYAYAGNNPATWTDPTGLCSKNWDLRDKLDCPKVAAEWGIEYVKSPWNQAQFVQNVGWLLTTTCETGFGCAVAGAFLTWSFQEKLQIICDEIKAGKLTVKEGSKKFLISLVPSPGTPPGTGVLGGKFLEKALPRDTHFRPLASCAD